jgi:hypothetical protein
MAKIKIKNSVTTGSVPAGLSFGEVAINIPDKKIFVGNAVESTVTLYDPNNHVLSFNGQTGAVSFVNYVSSVNGATGAVTISPAGSTGYIQYHTGAGFAADDGLFYTSDTETLTIGSGTRRIEIVPGVDNFVSALGTSKLRLTQSGGNEITIGDFDGTYGGNNTYLEVYDQTSTVSIFASNFNCQATAVMPFGLSASSLFVSTGATFDQYVNLKGGLQISGSSGTNGQVLTSTGSGITWATASSGFTYTASAPASPSIGDRWMDSDTGKEYIYISDGDSSQWIQPVASNGLVGITYDSSTNSYTVGATLDFKGSVSSDGGFRITANAINALTGTTYSLLSSDNGKVITWSNASGVTLTVPSGLPVGFNTTIIQIGAGAVGITGSGTTLNSFEGKLRTAGQHAAVSIISYSSNVFNIAGGLTA